MSAKLALQEFIREVSPGGCRMLSKDEDCDCELCQLDSMEVQVRQQTAAKCAEIARRSGGYIAEARIKKEFHLP